MSAHRSTLVHLVREQGWTKGAELGVDKGILFGMLLKLCPNLSLIGVDNFVDRERSHRVFKLSDDYKDRVQVLEMTTKEASKHVTDGSLDFVFIDADHSDTAVTEDIQLWAPKVRKGGWLGGHDYSPKFPGVIKAVDRAFGDKVEQLPGTIWGIQL